jgi:hypothetical protein
LENLLEGEQKLVAVSAHFFEKSINHDWAPGGGNELPEFKAVRDLSNAIRALDPKLNTLVKDVGGSFSTAMAFGTEPSAAQKANLEADKKRLESVAKAMSASNTTAADVAQGTLKLPKGFALY